MNILLIKFKGWLTYLLLFSALLEQLIYFSPINLMATIILLYGWFLISNVVLTINNLENYPASFLMFLGWGIFHFVLPLPLTLIEFKEITFNMLVPELTFFHQFLLVTVIVFTHFCYRTIANKKNIFRTILANTNFYYLPTHTQIWISSLLALMSTFYIYFVYGSWENVGTEKSLPEYIANIFAIFNWMPILLLFPEFTASKQKSTPRMTRIVLVYCVLLGIVSIASNYRTLLFSGFMMVGVLYLLGVLYGYYDVKNFFKPKKLIIASIAIYIISGPLVDLGFAMVSVRNERYSTSSADFIKQTFDLYQNKDELQRLRNLLAVAVDNKTTTYKGWDEAYLNNYLMNRFCNLKISDECLFHAQSIGYANREMQEDFAKQLKALSPGVFLSILNFSSAEKLEIASYSITDKLYSISVKSPYVLGSFLIGSLPGIGMAIFGYWYLLVLFSLFLLIFPLFDSFVYVKNKKVFFSYCFFTLLITVINYFNDRHVYYFEFRFILRTYIETVVIFIVIMHSIRFIEKFIKTKKDYGSSRLSNKVGS